MNYQENSFEKKARNYVDKLKSEYFIDMLTAERLQDIVVYLYLSQASKNQRGVDMQTENLKNILQNCPKTAAESYRAGQFSRGCRTESNAYAF